MQPYVSALLVSTSVLGLLGADGIHRTKDASEKAADLWCYRCDSLFDGPHCEKIKGNYSMPFQGKCPSDHRYCKTNVINATINIGHTLTIGKHLVWSVQRDCTKSCDEGCITIGERTKLHSCVYCCEKDLCNFSKATTNHINKLINIFMSYIPINVVKRWTTNF